MNHAKTKLFFLFLLVACFKLYGQSDLPDSTRELIKDSVFANAGDTLNSHWWFHSAFNRQHYCAGISPGSLGKYAIRLEPNTTRRYCDMVSYYMPCDSGTQYFVISFWAKVVKPSDWLVGYGGWRVGVKTPHRPLSQIHEGGIKKYDTVWKQYSIRTWLTAKPYDTVVVHLAGAYACDSTYIPDLPDGVVVFDRIHLKQLVYEPYKYTGAFPHRVGDQWKYLFSRKRYNDSSGKEEMLRDTVKVEIVHDTVMLNGNKGTIWMFTGNRLGSADSALLFVLSTGKTIIIRELNRHLKHLKKVYYEFPTVSFKMPFSPTIDSDKSSGFVSYKVFKFDTVMVASKSYRNGYEIQEYQRSTPNCNYGERFWFKNNIGLLRFQIQITNMCSSWANGDWELLEFKKKE
jgi:hypothetical protein